MAFQGSFPEGVGKTRLFRKFEDESSFDKPFLREGQKTGGSSQKEVVIQPLTPTDVRHEAFLFACEFVALRLLSLIVEGAFTTHSHRRWERRVTSQVSPSDYPFHSLAPGLGGHGSNLENQEVGRREAELFYARRPPRG